MKTKLFPVTVLVFALALLLAWAVGAQGPQPPRPGPAIPTPEPFSWEGPEGHPLSRFPAGPSLQATGIGPAAVSFGQPGLSFRYVQTFGVTEEPFFETNDHFYWVEGVGTVGNAVWIADTLAHRVLKFDASGNFITKIGKAGVIDYAQTSLARITDVAEDVSGNVWVVDAEASHVVKYNSSGQEVSELGQAWNSGSDNTRFENPISIAFDGSGNIYISDSGYWGSDYGNNRVQIFDSSGTHIATIGGGACGTGATQLCWPRHIAVYDNFLYVADADNHRVQIFNISTPSAPGYVATLGQTGSLGSANNQFRRPQGVAVDASYIYVADTENQRVQVFNRNTLAYVTTIGGSYGTGNNQFKYPTDVAVDASGNIYVADYGNKRVQQFNSSRVYQRTYGTTGDSYVEANDRFYHPEGVAVGPDGSIYIAEGYGHRLVKLNAAGIPQWTVGEAGQPGDDNAHFGYLQDVSVGPDGRIYTVEGWGLAPYMPGGNHRVQIFNPDGTYSGGFGGWGDGNYQFKAPTGIGFDPRNGNLYVADRDNHRVQIYNNQLAYVGTLGVTGQSGSDNTHFDSPFDVAVDSNGYIYVADEGNDRVQVFNSSRQYVRTIGGGGTGDDFGHFDDWGPHHLAVDSQGRLYVVDSGNSRVQVFDNFANGNAYLTTIGGAGGTQPGRFSNVLGIAIGPDDSVYTSEIHNNHRIQKFAPGVPGWKQVNINGFGDPGNGFVSTLDVFDGYMYAGTWSAKIWRTSDGQTWTQVAPSNWPTSTGVFDAISFGSYLYVGTAADGGGEIWRTDASSWEQVVSAGFGITQNYGINALTVFSDTLYAATSNRDGVLQVYRSSIGNAGTWTAVVTDGFGGNGVWQDVTMDVYNGFLYLGLGRNGVAELWRTADGTTWTPVFTDGLAPNNTQVSAMAEFNGGFYIGLRNVTTGGEVWRSADGINWTPVITGGLGSPNNGRPYGLIVFDGRLYLVFSNLVTGAEVWRSADGTTWEKVADAGWGDSNNYFADYFDKGATIFTNRLYIGTSNWANGGEVWLFLHNRVYLPLVLRNR